jgi:hypothetical protein
MSTQYRLMQSGKTASGGCSAGQGSSEPVAPRIYLFFLEVKVMWSLYYQDNNGHADFAACILNAEAFGLRYNINLLCSFLP